MAKQIIKRQIRIRARRTPVRIEVTETQFKRAQQLSNKYAGSSPTVEQWESCLGKNIATKILSCVAHDYEIELIVK